MARHQEDMAHEIASFIMDELTGRTTPEEEEAYARDTEWILSAALKDADEDPWRQEAIAQETAAKLTDRLEELLICDSELGNLRTLVDHAVHKLFELHEA